MYPFKVFFVPRTALISHVYFSLGTSSTGQTGKPSVLRELTNILVIMLKL